MGLPVEMFPVLFVILRTSGWLAQWEKQFQEPDQRIVRPRRIYDGRDARDYVPRGRRDLDRERPTHLCQAGGSGVYG